jgi:DNA-3-methyladenine glycosylase II
MTVKSDHYTKARRHLARRDPVLKKVIANIGACTLWHETNRFALLVRSIVSQQISGKAARSISARLAALRPRGLTPGGVLRLTEDQLRGAGLSKSKTRAVCDLAEKVKSGSVSLADIHEREDEDVIAHLLPVFGIGRWTAEMFLIFSLGRLDVLPVNDLGLRVGVQKLYNLAEPPRQEALIKLAQPWQPYRSVATWYIWRSLGGVPQSE